MNGECDNSIVVISNFTFCKLDILFTTMFIPQPFLLHYQKRKLVHEKWVNCPKNKSPKERICFCALVMKLGGGWQCFTLH